MKISKYYYLVFIVVLFSCDDSVQKINSAKKSEGETNSIVLKERGWGKVNLESNIKDNRFLIKIEESEIPDENCYYVSGDGKWSKSEPDIKVVDNKISVIESAIPFTTDYYGVSVGDNENIIYEKIGKNLFEKIENDDLDVSNQYFIVVWSSLEKKYGVKYNIVNGLITEISVGNSEVVYSGCV